jgi:hypothetical protein
VVVVVVVVVVAAAVVVVVVAIVTTTAHFGCPTGTTCKHTYKLHAQKIGNNSQMCSIMQTYLRMRTT